MSRGLSESDWGILKKLAPEINDDGVCGTSQKPYKSIMAPLIKHYAASWEDFTERLERLSDEDFARILERAEKDEECVSCLRPDFRAEYLKLVERRASPERAALLISAVEEHDRKYGKKV